MKVIIETERLIIRQVSVDDAEAVFKWASDPEVTKYMIYPTHDNIEITRNWLAGRNVDDVDSYDLGFTLKESGELIGMGGLVYKSEEDLWEIGYNLRKDYWGKGIVPEAMEGIISEILRVRPIRAIRGQFAEENKKSGRVMEKLGMHYLKDGEYSKTDKSESFKSKIYIKEF